LRQQFLYLSPQFWIRLAEQLLALAGSRFDHPLIQIFDLPPLSRGHTSPVARAVWQHPLCQETSHASQAFLISEAWEFVQYRTR